MWTKAGYRLETSCWAWLSSKLFQDQILIVNTRTLPHLKRLEFNVGVLTYLFSAVAVYLATLAVKGTSLNAAAGAFIGYIAIFSPGQFIHTGTMGLWKFLRRHQSVISCLRGVNASAVGLVYTAVYRLWEIGYIDEAYQSGSSLGKEPWWVVITATSFVGGMWFKLPAPAAIVLGGIMGLIWFAIVKA